MRKFMRRILPQSVEVPYSLVWPAKQCRPQGLGKNLTVYVVCCISGAIRQPDYVLRPAVHSCFLTARDRNADLSRDVVCNSILGERPAPCILNRVLDRACCLVKLVLGQVAALLRINGNAR